MKSNGRIRQLLQLPCADDYQYSYLVVQPLLEYLGIPRDKCWPQFRIENPFGAGMLRLDFLVHVGDVPMVTVESEPRATLFEEGYRQAKNYSTNFRPRQPGSAMQEKTVPFILVAAGTRAEMRCAVIRGLNIDYEPVLENGRQAFLEWAELEAEAQRLAGTIGEQHQVLKAEAAQQFFEDLYTAISSAVALRKKDDRKIVLFNEVIDYARENRLPKVRTNCLRAGLSDRATSRVLGAISLYQQKVDTNEFSGPAVVRGYRTFLLQPGGRGGHEYFTGESQNRPYMVGGRVRYRNVARYFTPGEVIQQMVRLADPHSQERVIDMACGSGGFLAECVTYVAQAEGDAQAQDFLTKRLVGIDDDPFCVSCSRELLTFLYPQHADRLQVYLHNCLYQRAPVRSELREDPRAEPLLAPGRYDLVIGNPPGNDEYSGTNPEEIARQWEVRFGHTQGGLMDHHCFVRRAVELARPDGGRICLLVPEGLLARDNRDLPRLRYELLRECEIRAIISLPRVFRNNNARMAVLYLV
ncbi:MAG TPA: N-6 DNA methylase, partial [Gemmataceae bacterium]|nr:N-6 DNA methylase [Gemmataceae bacterium]